MTNRENTVIYGGYLGGRSWEGGIASRRHYMVDLLVIVKLPASHFEGLLRLIVLLKER